MTNITFEQLNILTKEQLYNILKTILSKSYQKMNDNIDLINIFNSRYEIPDNIDNISKEDIIKILCKFYPASS